MPQSLPERIYHLAEASNWPSIQRVGLHCASALFDHAAVSLQRRSQLERRQRLTHSTLPGGVQIRDQRPLPARALASCLVGLSPAEWYAMINARVFFWLDSRRLNRQRRACGTRPQIVLTLDSKRLIDAYAERVEMTAINSGNARRKPAVRGAATFVSYRDWTHSRWAVEAYGLRIRQRPRSHRPVELTVLGSIPDAMTFIVDTCPLDAGELFVPPD